MITLATEGPLLDLDAALRSSLRRQRDRIAGLVGSLDGAQWSLTSRCPDWSVQSVLLHLRWAQERLGAVLDGTHVPTGKPFDPNRTPGEYVSAHVGELPGRTGDTLVAAMDRVLGEADRLGDAGSTTTAPSLWGAPVDWRLLVAHIHWDALVHERDIAEPLGREVGADPADEQLALAYGLVLGTLGVALNGGDVDDSVATDRARAAVRINHGRTVVTVRPGDGTGPEVGAVLDVASGRGDRSVRDVLGPGPVSDALDGFRGFLRG